MAAQFEWPWQHSFPPFFTVQPNSDTRAKQIEDWCELVLAYYKFNSLYRLDIAEAQNGPVFSNKTTNRKLSIEGIILVLEKLQEKGHLEWEDAKTKNRCVIMWRTPEEWADMIYNWVQENGLTDTVCTLYELVSGEEAGTQDTDFTDTNHRKKPIKRRRQSSMSETRTPKPFAKRSKLQKHEERNSSTEEFKGLDMLILKRALQALERRGKAQILQGEDSNEDAGVKFYS